MDQTDTRCTFRRLIDFGRSFYWKKTEEELKKAKEAREEKSKNSWDRERDTYGDAKFAEERRVFELFELNGF